MVSVLVVGGFNKTPPVLQYLLVNNVLSNKKICMCSFRKKVFICISRECKPLSRLGDLVVSHYTNLFVHEKQSDLFNSTFFYTFRGEIFLKKKIGKFKE